MKPFSFKERLRSFQYAFNGIRLTLLKEPNFRIHLFSASAVIVLGFYFSIQPTEWLWIALAIGLVLVTEMVNTAIERLVDLAEPNQNPKAGAIKDIAAGAVLAATLTSLTIGIVVFWPYFCLLLS